MDQGEKRPRAGSVTFSDRRIRTDSKAFTEKRARTDSNAFSKKRARADSTATTHGITFRLGEDIAVSPEDLDGHKIRALFCELTELKYNKKRPGADPEWRETASSDKELLWFDGPVYRKATARWVKFEEDVEEGGNRWSKPFVASLSLHSLVQLRSYLLYGSIFLDYDASNLHELWTGVIDTWVKLKALPGDERDSILAMLLQRPRHLNQKRIRKTGSTDQESLTGRSFSQFFRSSSNNLLERIDTSKDRSLAVNGESSANLQSISRDESKNLDKMMSQLCNKLLAGFTHGPTPNLHFMKKLPSGSEAANIMVAELEYLARPLAAFIRLQRPTFLGNLTEVPVPTRFLFVLLGPKITADAYHQIGRTMGTLLSDELFQHAAYKAKDKTDVLHALDEFLEASTVLPPGEWDPNIRIEPPMQVQTQESRVMDKLKREASSANILDALTANGHAGKSTHASDVRRTGRLFGGFMDDVKRKIRFYVSDFKDALHVQCLASFVFLYFASMTPLITFGGLMSDLLKTRMGAVETILGRSLSGVVWGFTAGQPLVILGSTGPILVFEMLSFKMCQSFGIDYLPMRLWIGLWAMLLLLLMVLFDLSSLVSYITRFTEESFAALVSAIFVYEAFKKLFHIAEEEPLRTHPGELVEPDPCECVIRSRVTESNFTTSTYQISENFTREACRLTSNITRNITAELVGPGCPEIAYIPDAFLLSVILFFGTFFIARMLKDFKTTPYFPNRLRQFCSDFAVIISISIFVGIDYALGIPTPKLAVPENLEPTYEARNGSWIVPLFGENAWWTPLAAFVPGVLITILIFMDQQITAVIVNRKENRFRKGKGYHLDLFVVAILTGVLSVLGMPWMVADTVLSLTHVTSLRMESEVAAPGERPTFLGVREQRVTNIVIAVFIGVSIFMTKFLEIIPMPVLFGVFLFMGVNALNGLQFTDRLKLVFMPLKHQPDYAYLRHVKIKRVHIFTAAQLLCLVVLWVLKSFLETAMLFPVMVGALVGVRKLMDYVFTQYELGFLDDIMPEHVKRKKEDKQRRKSVSPAGTVQTERSELSSSADDDFVKIKLPNGNLLAVPLTKRQMSVAKGLDALDFTNALNTTGLWKNASSGNLLGQVKETDEHRRDDYDGSRKRWNTGNILSLSEKRSLTAPLDSPDEE